MASNGEDPVPEKQGFGRSVSQQNNKEDFDSDTEQRQPMMPHSGSGVIQPPGDQQSEQDKMEEDNPSPVGIKAWIGFGCAIFALAALSVAFASPYWVQTYPNSFNTFQNLGLWEVCMNNYMHHKDDSQEIYDGCWWVFNRDKKYWKLREWLLPPWFIACQVMGIGTLLLEIGTCFVVAAVFLHGCPFAHHEWHQTYAMFGAASTSFLSTMTILIAGTVFAELHQDRQWMPRPDQNFLSWGYGFFIISGIFSLAAGICLYLEAKRAYEVLVLAEERTRQQIAEWEQMSHQQSFYSDYDKQSQFSPASEKSFGQYDPPQYNGQQSYEKPGFDQPGYGGGQPGYGPSSPGYNQPYPPKSPGYQDYPPNTGYDQSKYPQKA